MTRSPAHLRPPPTAAAPEPRARCTASATMPRRSRSPICWPIASRCWPPSATATRRLPWDEIEAYTESGLGAITVPKAYGGTGARYETVARVFEILCAADPALGQIPQNQFGVLALVHDIGTEAQKARIYADVLGGHRIGNAGPERKTRLITIATTRLEETGEGLRLTGERFYSTGSIFAHYIPTRAVDAEGRAVQVWARGDAEA